VVYVVTVFCLIFFQYTFSIDSEYCAVVSRFVTDEKRESEKTVIVDIIVSK